MDALDLPHADAGPRDAPAVLLLHGFPLHHGMWAHQKAALQAAGLRVVVPDLRGHGKAPVGRGPATMQAHAADVLRLADRAGLRRFALAGFSMGGYVALEVARQAPQRLAGLALVDSRAEPDSEEAAKGRLATAERVRREGMGVLEEAMVPKFFTPATLRDAPALVDGARAMMRAMPPEGAAQALQGMASRPDQRALLPTLRVPALVVVGEEDALTPPSASEAMAAAIPGARLVRVPGAAHLTPMERPEAVSDALVAWARGLTA